MKLLPILLSSLIMACAPAQQHNREAVQSPYIEAERLVTADNAILPFQVWQADATEAVVIGLHGFNDYSHSFAELGEYLAANHQVTVYAYDQRGFGAAGERGTWAGNETYIEDLRQFCQVIRKRHPDTSIYVLGESMGAAIAMVAFTSEDKPDADGVILSAPAVWARKTMPWYQRLALFIGSRLFPWASFTGEGIKVTPSDNRDMLIALGQDPLVIKATKVEAMYGLTNLMDQALASAAQFNEPAFVLIGDRDEIVPNHASAVMLNNFSQPLMQEQKIAVYENGYHMLWRDLQGPVVMQDIASWIADHSAILPSKEDQIDLNTWVEENLP